MNKTINRDHQTTNKIFDDRTVEVDYATLIPLLKPGLRILDIGCGTGAISRGIATRVGPAGHVTGIDNTEKFIVSGREHYGDTPNLELIHTDLFQYEPKEKFDLIVSARTLQWLSNPQEAIEKLKTFLQPGGQLSVLDYNHEALEWTPQPPESMRYFYKQFLQWRADAGMNNHIAEDLADYFEKAGFHAIEVYPSNEVYSRGDDNFIQRAGIWSKVAGLRQMVEEGYIMEERRLQAIEEYDAWIATDAEQMIMKLKEVRGKM